MRLWHRLLLLCASVSVASLLGYATWQLHAFASGFSACLDTLALERAEQLAQRLLQPIQALSRGSRAPADDGIVLDADHLDARVDGSALALTPVEFRLRRLREKPGKVYSRSQLLDASYEDHRIVSDRTVDSHSRNRRRQFSEVGHDPVESVYGVGFRLELDRDR